MVVTREEALDRLGGGRFDLLVVGAGIVGAGIANEAARAGLRVALVDRGDFGAATSSASSKLIHGGLRYLRLGDVGLVREAHRERRALLRVVAPHLVRRLPFLMPLYEHGPYRPLVVQAGLWLYSTLARERLGGLAPPERALRSVPDLRTEGLRGCGVYADATTHDGRLCLANVRAAAERGAVAANYVEVADLRLAGGRVQGAELRNRIGGGALSVEARAVVNATGPWLERLRRLEDPHVAPYGQLSKGVHLLLPLERPWSAALAVPHDKVRVTFAYPWEGTLLLGTTDDAYDGEPNDAGVTDRDVARVLEEASVAVEPALLRPERVRASFAGLRVLPASTDGPLAARRETAFLTGRGGMLTVAGGKLTTYRRIALGALERLAPVLGLESLERAPVPLPGAADLEHVAARLARHPAGLDADVRAHLAHLYGSLATEVLDEAAADPALTERLHPDGPDVAAQVVYAVRREWATGAEDVLRRRTTVWSRGLDTPEVAAAVERLLEGARLARAVPPPA
ncbi:MAG TPA: glycerol-3-phosphate dehydrogenase/oxidase [Gaiellaceae bacterium]|nr:glycerol-3-phosphate dehydrogenase/oxidase [Gaiellaceae bacterium]